jgi:hypothetical protein
LLGVPVEMGNVSDLLPSEENYNKLQQRLSVLQRSQTGNSSTYYDPTSGEREREFKAVSDALESMKYQLDNRNDKVGIKTIRPQLFVQNAFNAEVEDSGSHVANLLRSVEPAVNVSTPITQIPQRSAYADGNVSQPFEAEDVGAKLGSKYVTDTPKLQVKVGQAEPALLTTSTSGLSSTANYKTVVTNTETTNKVVPQEMPTVVNSSNNDSLKRAYSPVIVDKLDETDKSSSTEERKTFNLPTQQVTSAEAKTADKVTIPEVKSNGNKENSKNADKQIVSKEQGENPVKSERALKGDSKDSESLPKIEVTSKAIEIKKEAAGEKSVTEAKEESKRKEVVKQIEENKTNKIENTRQEEKKVTNENQTKVSESIKEVAKKETQVENKLKKR